jgi:hypothetical protein
MSSYNGRTNLAQELPFGGGGSFNWRDGLKSGAGNPSPSSPPIFSSEKVLQIRDFLSQRLGVVEHYGVALESLLLSFPS